jgi:hypothetical protein
VLVDESAEDTIEEDDASIPGGVRKKGRARGKRPRHQSCWMTSDDMKERDKLVQSESFVLRCRATRGAAQTAVKDLCVQVRGSSPGDGRLTIRATI